MQYQIEQKWSDGGIVWDYFTSEETDETELKLKAQKIVQEAHARKLEMATWRMFTNTTPSRPTIIIREYPVKKGGLILKTKWR